MPLATTRCAGTLSGFKELPQTLNFCFYGRGAARGMGSGKLSSADSKVSPWKMGVWLDSGCGEVSEISRNFYNSPCRNCTMRVVLTRMPDMHNLFHSFLRNGLLAGYWACNDGPVATDPGCLAVKIPKIGIE